MTHSHTQRCRNGYFSTRPYVAITTLRGNQNNTRRHTKKQIEQIARSLDRRGFTSPLIVKNNIVYIGNGRLAAAKKRGFEEVPIIRVDDMSDTEIRAYAIDGTTQSLVKPTCSR